MTDKRSQQAVVGLSLCLCGCGVLVKNVKNRNGRVKEYATDKCRTRTTVRAQKIGRKVLSGVRSEESGDKVVERVVKYLSRRQGKPRVDDDLYLYGKHLAPQERLGALCRAAERVGVIKK